MRSDRFFEFPVAVAASEGSHADVESTHSSKVFIDIKTIPNPARILGKRRKGGIYTQKKMDLQPNGGRVISEMWVLLCKTVGNLP